MPKKTTPTNNLKVVNPKLAEEWHPIKNGDLQPEDVFPNSTKVVWWKCNKGHEWQRKVVSRNSKAGLCPYCINQIVLPENSLASKHTSLAEEWHPQKNEKLTAYDVPPGSSKKVWWQCEKGHEWQATINSRVRGRGCPYCSKRIAFKTNNLADLYPNIAKDWHPTKNGDLTPYKVVPGSNKKVWWQCEGGHEWKTQVQVRTRGSDCPYCKNSLVTDKNNLQVVNPSLANEWHPIKNHPLTQDSVLPFSTTVVWWQCENGHEWQSKVATRNTGNGCPYCSNHLVNEGNCLGNLNPELAKEWHPTKNGHLTPYKVVLGSSRKVWWQCENGHEWQAQISNRVHGNSCPTCNLTGTSVVEYFFYEEFCKVFGTNNIKHRARPIKTLSFEADIYLPKFKLAIEYDGEYWHRNHEKKDLEKNELFISNGITVIRIREEKLKKISPQDQIYKYRSEEQAYKVMKNILQYIQGNYEVNQSQKNRIEKYLENKTGLTIKRTRTKILKKISFVEYYPHLKDEWNYDRNGDLVPEMFTNGSGVKVWWRCAKGHEWQAAIYSRVSGRGCHLCSGKIATATDNLSVHFPAIAKDWHYKKNGNLTPEEVKAGSQKKVWWLCSFCGHEWEQAIKTRTRLLYPCKKCKQLREE